jgi:hypothetical protein
MAFVACKKGETYLELNCMSDLKTQSVPRCKHCALVIKTDQLMLYKEIIAVCSQIHTKHTNAFWAESRLLIVIPGGA